MNRVFVLGAGFSREQGYPLVCDMRNEVIRFLKREQNVRYWDCMQPGTHGYEKGLFFAGLEMIDPNEELQFEELLVELNKKLEKKDG